MQTLLSPVNPSKNSNLQTKIQILRTLFEHLMWELQAIRDQQWEKLPQLSTKKSQLVNQLSEFDWTPSPQERNDSEFVILKSQIIDLNLQSQRLLKNQSHIIRKHLEDLEIRNHQWQNSLKSYRKK